MSKQNVNVQVVNVIGRRSNGSWLLALALIGLVLWLWKFFLLAAVLAAVGAVFLDVCRRIKRDRIAILQRADQQHAWVMKGDPRGTYGPGFAWNIGPIWPGPVPKPPSERIRIVGGETVEVHQ